MKAGDLLNRRQEEVNNHCGGFLYWQQFVQCRLVDEIMIGNMENKNITLNSIFVYISFLDLEKNIFKSGWSLHKDIETMIGYLRHVFFPTAFYSWIDRESEGFFIPLSPFEVVKTEVMKLKKENNKDSDVVNTFEELINGLDGLDTSNRQNAISKLKNICIEFNEKFDNLSDRKMYIRIFGHSTEIIDFILGDGDDYFIEVIEEDINMSINKFKQLCVKVYDEPLINRTFINHLNQKVPFWI